MKLAILGKDFTLQPVFIAWESWVNALNIHISCYITDTDGRYKPMNLGRLWICLVGITPSNNPGTEREILPYMVRDSPYIALYGHWATPLVMEYNSRAREYCVIVGGAHEKSGIKAPLFLHGWGGAGWMGVVGFGGGWVGGMVCW